MVFTYKKKPKKRVITTYLIKKKGKMIKIRTISFSRMMSSLPLISSNLSSKIALVIKW